MSNRKCLSHLIFLCAIALVLGKETFKPHKQNCRENEVYLKCGPACEHTCFDLIEESPCKKEEVCVRGCFCKKGFWRNAFGDCVTAMECFPQSETIGCGSDEIFDKCNGNCEKTCDNHGTSFKCSKKCVPGCLCMEGLVRNEEGNCIPPEFCHKMLPEPKICNSPFEEFHYCYAACEATCKNLDVPLNCADKCKAGCRCKEGLVRDENNNCILPHYCNNTDTHSYGICVGAHEVFGCGFCDTKCATLGMPCLNYSPKCTERCYCDIGYARDHRNICIPIRKCPKYCNFTLKTFLKSVSLMY